MRVVILGIFTILTVCVFAQSSEITRRDERYLRENGVPVLVNALESSYNIISDQNAYPNEVVDHIRKIVAGEKFERLFFNEKVVIQSDLTPGSDTLKNPTVLPVGDYFNAFNSLYKKTSDPSITIRNVKVSGLKYKSYLYYNVLFDLTFGGTNSANQVYTTVQRIAEVRVDGDSSSWVPYINGIRFAEPFFNIDDSLNMLTNFKSDPTDLISYEEYITKVNEEKKKKQDEEEVKIRGFISDGEIAFDKGDLEIAKNQFSKAWVINPHDKTVIDHRKKVDIAIEEKIKEEKERRELEAAVAKLKVKADEAYELFEFSRAAEMYDSLNQIYGIKNEALIETRRSELATINSSLDAIYNALRENRYDDAQRFCDRNIKSSKNKLLVNECYYLKALTYFKEDSTNTNKVHNNLRYVLDNTKSTHSRALVLEATVFKSERRYDEAIQTASLLVNLHSDDPRYYILRAQIHTANRNKAAAINDYQKSIYFKTIDSIAYVSKAKLEFETDKLQDAILTAGAVINRTKCYSAAFYYRGMANEKIGEFKAAGLDFWNAKKCGLDSVKDANCHFIANGYYKQGEKSYFDKKYEASISDLSKSILLDSNENSFYCRGLAYLAINRLDSAEDDFTILLKLNSKYNLAFFQRGNVLAIKQKYREAISDFSQELLRDAGVMAVYLEKAKAELKLNNYYQAGKDAEIAGRGAKLDIACQLSTEAYYECDSIDKAISVATFAESELKSLNHIIYYIRGRAYFDKSDLKRSRKDFERALEIDGTMSEASYWLGRTFFESRKFQEAISPFNSGLSSKEFMAEANYYLALSQIKAHPSKEIAGTIMNSSANNFKTALALDSAKFNNATTLSWIAYAYLLQDEHERAEQYLKQASGKSSTNSIYFFVRACFLIKSGTYGQALDFLESAGKKGGLKREDVVDEPLFEAFYEDKLSKARYKEILSAYFQE